MLEPTPIAASLPESSATSLARQHRVVYLERLHVCQLALAILYVVFALGMTAVEQFSWDYQRVQELVLVLGLVGSFVFSVEYLLRSARRLPFHLEPTDAVLMTILLFLLAPFCLYWSPALICLTIFVAVALAWHRARHERLREGNEQAVEDQGDPHALGPWPVSQRWQMKTPYARRIHEARLVAALNLMVLAACAWTARFIDRTFGEWLWNAWPAIGLVVAYIFAMEYLCRVWSQRQDHREQFTLTQLLGFTTLSGVLGTIYRFSGATVVVYLLLVAIAFSLIVAYFTSRSDRRAHPLRVNELPEQELRLDDSRLAWLTEFVPPRECALDELHVEESAPVEPDFFERIEFESDASGTDDNDEFRNNEFGQRESGNIDSSDQFEFAGESLFSDQAPDLPPRIEASLAKEVKAMSVDLSRYGIKVKNVTRNAPPGRLYEDAVRYDGGQITNTGALVSFSGEKTGRSPADKRIVDHPDSHDHIWWGSVNIPIDANAFGINRQRAVDFFNTQKHLYVVDAFAGWDPKYQMKIRIICVRPYHALFMHNMLIRPTDEELANFGDPDFTVFNSGQFPANTFTKYMTSSTSVDLSFEDSEFVILGTEYAGEMKKGVFTVMNYLMPKQDVLSMHCSANVGNDENDVSLFFGLSGTGKTTLSADINRHLVGDDEHCWSDNGVFNIEGGCYAKCIGLSHESEPEIYDAIKFGSVLENVVMDPETRQVDFDSNAITENTRVSYPVEYIPNVRIPCTANHPRNIIFLTCDAFGVLPPVSKLTPEQAMYHFISGYTAKVAGTEMGVTEPQATFSACFGAAFMVWHPTKYAELLADKIREHQSQVWLVNTGWTGGPHGVGSRIKLKYTRAIIDAIHSGELAAAKCATDPNFGLSVPEECSNVPTEILQPRETWADGAKFDAQAQHLSKLFNDNFKKYEDVASDEVKAAGPQAMAERA